MMSLAALQMGKYGVYVWSCYGLTLAALVYLVFATRHQWQVELKQARRRMQMAEQQNVTSQAGQS